MKKTNSLYVLSSVNALVKGILREDKTLKVVLEHGDFGLSNDKHRGGHLLGFLSTSVEIKIEPIEQLTLDLPHSIDFLTANLDGDISDDLDRAEH